MGRMLIEALRASDDCVLTGALDVAASPAIGSDATAFLGVASGVPITADLREAPDVIMIGEIRDRNTMKQAIAYAETGHLCLSTLHANNANQAMERVITSSRKMRTTSCSSTSA